MKLKNYAPSILQLVIVFSTFCLLEIVLEEYTTIQELHWAVVIFLKLMQILFLAVLLDFSKEVRIENGTLIKGNYNRIFGFIRIESRFKMTSIKDVVIVQNVKNYFEIKIIAVEGEMIIDTIPNRIPANKELERVKKIIQDNC